MPKAKAKTIKVESPHRVCRECHRKIEGTLFVTLEETGEHRCVDCSVKRRLEPAYRASIRRLVAQLLREIPFDDETNNQVHG